MLSSFVLSSDELRVDTHDDAIGAYSFGTGEARHHFCRTCGIFTHVRTRLDPGKYRVNLGCVDEIDVYALPAPVFEGKSI